MAITRDDVQNIALLARLRLSDSEAQEMTEQLDRILEYVRGLDGLDTEAVEPTAHVTPLATPFREDEASNDPAVERWMANAPARDDRHFRVPKIIE